MKQLTELWSNYGELFEIWFDGGVPPVEDGGPPVADLLHELQPNAVVFQGPKGSRSLVRWCGNERAEPAEDCSAVFRYFTQRSDGMSDIDFLRYGDAEGDTWAPAEADTPNRDAKKAFLQGWFWKPDQDDTVFPAEYLFDRYLKSVGRNSNLLIGMPIDERGLFPEADREEFLRFGEMRRRVFGVPLAESEDGGRTVRLPEDAPEAGYLVMGEDIARGERVRRYVVHGRNAEGKEIFSHTGRVIGHKRILPLPPGVREVTLKIQRSDGEPCLRFLRLYGCL